MSDRKLTELVKDIKDNAVQAGVALKPATQKVIDASKVFTQNVRKPHKPRLNTLNGDSCIISF